MNRLIQLTLFLLVVMLPVTAKAYDFEVNGIYYYTSNITSINAIVTYQSYNTSDYTGSVTIPETVTYNGTTYSVTSIGERAFSGCSGLTSVAIPGTVTSVGGKAFYNCSGLTDVYCYIANPLSVSVAYDAFDLDDWDVVSDRTLHVLPGTTEAYYEVGWYWFFYQVIEDLIPEPEPQPGDVNGDREVNIADVNAVIDIILSGNSSTTAADVNGDGEVNIADVNAIIDIILTGSWH